MAFEQAKSQEVAFEQPHSGSDSSDNDSSEADEPIPILVTEFSKEITQADIDFLVNQTDCTQDQAREALQETNNDLVEAIMKITNLA